MIYVTKRLEFCAAHKLAVEQCSDGENEALFGACYQGAGHGHNYLLDVTIGGSIDPKTGMVFNMKKLKEIVQKEIIAKLDHTFLNDRDNLLKGKNPTTENLAVAIWQVLENALDTVKLAEIKLWETSNNSVTYRGEE